MFFGKVNIMLKKVTKIFKYKMPRCSQEHDINFDTLQQMIKKGAILVDVRSIQEFNEGHLQGAIHLADYEIPIKHNSILPNKNAIIIVYCQNGGRSKKAYKKLKKIGYTNIYNLCGGLDNIDYK